MNEEISALEEQLSSFDAEARASALGALLDLVAQGAIVLPAPAEVANMHCHTLDRKSVV